MVLVRNKSKIRWLREFGLIMLAKSRRDRMTQAELLDALAKAIDAPRRDGRLDAIKRALAAYTEALYTKRSWWDWLLGRRV